VTSQETIRFPTGTVRIPSDLSTLHSDGFLVRTEVGVSGVVVYLTREIENLATADPSATTAEAVVRICMNFESLMRLSEGLYAVTSEFVLAAK
jgi:hypothetical protein